MSNISYRFLSHVDAPKRFFTLTIDEFVIAVTGFLLLVVTNQKILVPLLSFGLLSALRYLKKGEGPKALLVLAYWYLPHTATQFFLPTLPASHQRVWQA